MRDLYHRHDKLAYWIHRVNAELEEPDKTDVLKLVEHMQDRERAVLWITRCITALLLMRKQLGKSFRDANKDDIFAIYTMVPNMNISYMDQVTVSPLTSKVQIPLARWSMKM